MNYQGKYLYCVQDFGPIEAGTKAYCFVDESDTKVFRIWLSQPVLGMSEFTISYVHKKNFKILFLKFAKKFKIFLKVCQKFKSLFNFWKNL